MKCFEYDTELTMEYDAVFMDIETTGLKKETALLTILSCGYAKDGHLHITQWFNDDAVSEEKMLQCFSSFLEEVSGPVITFNGDQFDIPFLLAHLDYNDLSTECLAEHPNFDLYRFLRGYASLFDLENGKQKAWEAYLGEQREDQLSGKALIKLYKDYLKEKKEAQESYLLLHNTEDVKGLYHLMPLLSLEQLQKEEFIITDLQEDSFQGNPALTFTIECKDPLVKTFSVNGSSGSFFMDNPDTAKITLPVAEGKLYHFYENYQDYYYLPLEDRAIHKSIGLYVDKEHRKKANAKTCYVPEESIFLPLPQNAKGYGFEVSYASHTSLSAYRMCWEDKNRYINLNDLIDGQSLSEECRHYLGQMIQTIFLEKIRN